MGEKQYHVTEIQKKHSQRGCCSSPQTSGLSRGLDIPCTLLSLQSRSEGLFCNGINALHIKSTPVRHLSVSSEMTGSCSVPSKLSLMTAKSCPHTVTSQLSVVSFLKVTTEKTENTGTRKELSTINPRWYP